MSPYQQIDTKFNSYGPVHLSDNATLHQGDNVFIGEHPEDAGNREFLNKLMYNEMHSRAEAITSAHDGTFEWIFDQSRSDHFNSSAIGTFETWLMSAQSYTFWVSGKAGSGKSTLMSYVSSHKYCRRLLQEQSQDSQVIILKHYFWALGTRLQHDLSGMYRSLIWQMFQSMNSQQAFRVSIHEIGLSPGVVLSLANLRDAFLRLLQQNHRSCAIFLDGLDECDDRDELVKLLRDIEDRRAAKVCVSSRPERKFELAFSMWPKLRLQDLTNADIRLFARDQLSTVSFGDVSEHKGEDKKALLINLLVEKAQGVFVWLRVATRSLLEGIENYDEWEMLLERLREMPDDIYELYKHILNRGRANYKRYNASAARIFHYLLLPNEPPEGSSTWRVEKYGEIILPRLTLAIKEDLRKQYLHSTWQPHANSTLDDDFQMAQRQVRVHVGAHCGHFVDIQERQDDRYRTDVPQGTRHGTYGEVMVSFIHRSVSEFLLDTIEGRDLMSGCTETREEAITTMMQADLVLLLVEIYAAASRGARMRAGDRGIWLARNQRDTISFHGQERTHPDLICPDDERIYGDLLGIHTRYARAMFECEGIENAGELWAEHVRMMENCLMQIAAAPDSAQDFWILLFDDKETPRLPRKKEYGFLFWCACNGHLDLDAYLFTRLNSIKGHDRKQILSQLMWIWFKHRGTRPGYDFQPISLLEAIAAFLDRGADPSLPLSVICPDRTWLPQWMHSFNFSTFCFFRARARLHHEATRTILDLLLMLNQRGALIMPPEHFPPMFEILMVSCGLERFGGFPLLLSAWKPWTAIAAHRRLEQKMKDDRVVALAHDLTSHDKIVDECEHYITAVDILRGSASIDSPRPSCCVLLLQAVAHNGQNINNVWFGLDEPDHADLMLQASQPFLEHTCADCNRETIARRLHSSIYNYVPSQVQPFASVRSLEIWLKQNICRSGYLEEILSKAVELDSLAAVMRHLGWPEADIEASKVEGCPSANLHRRFPSVFESESQDSANRPSRASDGQFQQMVHNVDTTVGSCRRLRYNGHLWEWATVEEISRSRDAISNWFKSKAEAIERFRASTSLSETLREPVTSHHTD